MGQIKGLILKAADRPELERWARARNLPYRQVQRARMLLALAEGQADRVAMWQKLQEPPPAGHTRWSLSLMAQATGISRSQLQRWWSAAQIQPHRTRTFKRSQDPEFEAKLRDVVDLYQKKEARWSGAGRG